MRSCHRSAMLLALTILALGLPAPRSAAAERHLEAPGIGTQNPFVPGRGVLRFVAGVAVVPVELRAGANTYPCHLMLDFGQGAPLSLHRNAAGALGARSATVAIGGIELGPLSVEARRDEELEEFTRRHAAALQDLPVAGRLGFRAFGNTLVTLDGPAGEIRVQAPEDGAGWPDPAAPGIAVPLGTVDNHLLAYLRCGTPGEAALFQIDPKVPFSALGGQLPGFDGFLGGKSPAPILALRKPGEDPSAEAPDSGAAETMDLAEVTPFMRLVDGAKIGGQRIAGVIGGYALSRMTMRFQRAAGWVDLAIPAGSDPWPADEAAFLAARVAPDPVAGLRAWLQDEANQGSPLRQLAAANLLEEVREGGAADPAELLDAAKASVAAAAPDRKASTALELLQQLPKDATWWDLRREVAELGLADADRDLEGHAGHLLRVQLGRIYREQGNLKEAHRQLLSAVFGIPGEGMPNLELGRLHEAKGELLRARGRYLVATLDAKDTGEPGLALLQRVHNQLAQSGDEPPLVDYLEIATEGRTPALHPLPRPADQVNPTGRVILVELFTGAHCPPCTGADMAIDALGELFTPEEIAIVVWHLPVPAPEPLLNPSSLARASALGVRATPTVRIHGEQVQGGGPADAAPGLFAQYREVAEAQLAKDPEMSLTGVAYLENDTVSVRLDTDADLGRIHAVLVEEVVAFPGRNGVLLHRNVARLALTPGGGIPVGSLDKDGAGSRSWTTAIPRSTAASQANRALDEQTARGARFMLRPIDPDPERLAIVAWIAATGRQPQQAVRIPVQLRR